MSEQQPSIQSVGLAAAPVRVAVTALALSLAGIAGWIAREGDSPVVSVEGEERMAPHIPTQGDVPTIGHGSTRYEDGRPVRLTDPPIPRKRAEALALALHDEEAVRFRASLPGVELTQGEFDLYLDFTGQYGIGNWRGSSMRRELLATVGVPMEKAAVHYKRACAALLRYRYAAKYDCSTLVNGKPNKRCWGSWERQLERHAKCVAEQGG